MNALKIHLVGSGATPAHAPTYIANQETQNGQAVEFKERVTDEE